MKFRRPDTALEGLGTCQLLASRTATYADEQLTYITERLLGSIIRDQYIIMYDNKDKAVAFATWAYLNIETAQTFINRLRPLVGEEFKSGSQTWVVDFVCETVDSKPLVSWLKEQHKITEDTPIYSTKLDNGRTPMRVVKYFREKQEAK